LFFGNHLLCLYRLPDAGKEVWLPQQKPEADVFIMKLLDDV